MLAWLTLANDNGQSFPDAELLGCRRHNQY